MNILYQISIYTYTLILILIHIIIDIHIFFSSGYCLWLNSSLLWPESACLMRYSIFDAQECQLSAVASPWRNRSPRSSQQKQYAPISKSCHWEAKLWSALGVTHLLDTSMLGSASAKLGETRAHCKNRRAQRAM